MEWPEKLMQASSVRAGIQTQAESAGGIQRMLTQQAGRRTLITTRTPEQSCELMPLRSVGRLGTREARRQQLHGGGGDAKQQRSRVPFTSQTVTRYGWALPPRCPSRARHLGGQLVKRGHSEHYPVQVTQIVFWCSVSKDSGAASAGEGPIT